MQVRLVSTVSDGNIATVVGLISIFNGIGRVIFGGLFDKKGYRFTMILDMIIFIVAALILVLALVSGNFAFIVIGFVVGGLAYVELHRPTQRTSVISLAVKITP